MNSGLFSTGVGLFRALRFFLVQFGLPGDPAVLKAYHHMGNLKDDPSWLPLGPTGREINGTYCTFLCLSFAARILFFQCVYVSLAVCMNGYVIVVLLYLNLALLCGIFFGSMQQQDLCECFYAYGM